MSPSPSLHVVHRIRAGSRIPHTLPAHPDGLVLQRVWTLIDEPLLREIGPVHNVSAFLEDRLHDWRIDQQGHFFYYSRVTETGADVDIVLDYETNDQYKARQNGSAGARFDPMTGARLVNK